MLKILDEHYKNYDFPILENANFDLSQARLEVYLNEEEDWIISIQTVGVSEAGPSMWIYLYSNVLPDIFLFIADDEVIALAADREIFDDRGVFQVNLFQDKVFIQGNEYHFNYTADSYKKKEIVVKDNDSYPTYFMRMLAEVEETREMLWCSEKELKETLNLPQNWSLFYRTDNWEHTEVEEEKPSNILFFNSLANAMEKKDPSVIELGKVNTHWKNWVDYDFENQADWED